MTSSSTTSNAIISNASTIVSNNITSSSNNNITTRIVPIASKPSFLDEVLGINNITISNIVHHKVNWHKVLNSIPILQTKYYIGIIITIISGLLFILLLATIEKDHTAVRELDYITSIDNDNNDMVLSEEEETDNDTTGPRNGGSNDGSFIKEQDDHATPPKMRQQSSNKTKKKSYRKLLPSQKFIIVLQVTSLTVFNYLLLVLLPIDGGILPFLAMSILWIMTLRTMIRIEIMKKRRLDRIVTLVTLFFLLAAGLSLVTYTHHAKKEGEVYSGPARIVGYDSRSYNNTDGQTIRANLKVTWGGNWGCPHSLNNDGNPLYCTADVSGALCETRYKENKTKTALYQQKINNAPNETYVDYGNGTAVETITYKNGTTTSEDYYYDVYWEAVETMSPYGVLYKDKDEEVDIEYDENGEEGISVVYSNGEEVDVLKEDGSSTVNVLYGKNSTTDSDSDNYQEEDFTKNGTVIHPKTTTTSGSSSSSSSTTTGGNDGKTRVLRSLSTSSGKKTNSTSSANNTESVKIQKEVNATVAQDKANITKEEDNFNNELINEAEDTVIEDVNDYSTVINNDEDTIAKLQKENQNLQAANDKLKQEITAEKQSINVTEQQDENLIASEIKLKNEIATEKQNSNDARIKQGKAPQTYGASVNHYTYDDDIDIFTDDYWNYQWDNIWGEYACEDLFSQNNNEYGSYNPNEAPGTNESDKWPTIEIYGNCHTCSAYLIDYYTTENFHKAEQFQKASQFYFMATFISAFFAAFFFLQYTFRRPIVNNPDRQKELLSMSMHNTNLNQRSGGSALA